MARTSLEESAFAAARMISVQTNFTRVSVLGMLASLWHDSQSLERTHATRDQMIVWLDVGEGVLDDEIDQLIGIMTDNGLLNHIRDDAWEIVGNDKHINNLRDLKERGRQGGRLGGRPRKTLQETLEGSKSKPKGVTLQETPIQYSAVQSSAVQDSATQLKTKKQKPRSSIAGVGFDFESVYKLYPRKDGKSEGFKKAGREVKTPEDFDRLRSAVLRFAAHHRAQGTEAKFIPYFSRFMTNWRDWLDPETGTATAPDPSKPFDIGQVLAAERETVHRNGVA